MHSGPRGAEKGWESTHHAVKNSHRESLFFLKRKEHFRKGRTCSQNREIEGGQLSAAHGRLPNFCKRQTPQVRLEQPQRPSVGEGERSVVCSRYARPPNRKTKLGTGTGYSVDEA